MPALQRTIPRRCLQRDKTAMSPAGAAPGKFILGGVCKIPLEAATYVLALCRTSTDTP